MAFARAGHYTVSYSIGSCKTDIVGPSGTHWSDVYQATSTTASGGGTSEDPPSGGMVTIGSGTAHSYGPITVTFTWQGDDANDLPPPVAIVKETASAGWMGTSGSCSNGLGNTANATAYGQCSSGTSYWLKSNPGTSFTRTVSPDANGAFSGAGVPGGPVAAQVTVSYSATASPVRLVLDGTYKDTEKHDHALVGKGTSGHVSMDGDGLAGQTTFSNYSWTVTGDTFKQYVLGPGQATASVSYLTTTDLSQTCPVWYYKSCGSYDENVTLTVNISINGTSLGWATLPKSVTVWSVGGWSLSGYTDGSVNYGEGHSDVHAGGPPDGPVAGISIYSNVWTPLIFHNQYGDGQFAIAQLCQLDRDEPLDAIVSGIQAHIRVYFSDFRLDGSFPYDYTFYTAKQGTTCQIDDSPSFSLIWDGLSWNINDQWNAYLLFLPPAGGQWVPVAKLHWTWQTHGSRPTILSAWPEPIVGSVHADGSQGANVHPTWTALYAGSGLFGPP